MLLKTTVKNAIPYALFLALDYYALPLLIQNTGTAMVLLLVVVPLLCLICSIVYGIKQGFHLLYAVMAALLFVPSIFVYYNTSAWVYILIYGVVALIGNGIGCIFYRRV